MQTFDPEHHAVKAALAHDPALFYEPELEERRALGYPPFSRLVALHLEGSPRATPPPPPRPWPPVWSGPGQAGAPAQVLGPAPAPIARASGRWRWLILIKSPTSAAAAGILRLARHQAGPPPVGGACTWTWTPSACCKVRGQDRGG